MQRGADDPGHGSAGGEAHEQLQSLLRMLDSLDELLGLLDASASLSDAQRLELSEQSARLRRTAASMLDNAGGR